MKPRVVYALIASVWIIAGVLQVITIISVSTYLLWPLGIFLVQSSHPSLAILYPLPQAVSAISIVGTNVYLHRTIIQSKKKLENNLKLSGKDDHKVTKLQRLIHNLQLQLESSLPLFVLGGVDCLLNVLRVIIFVIFYVFYLRSSDFAISVYHYQLFVNPLEYCQIVSHSITYGLYKKEVKDKLCQYYQRLQRLLPLRPSKVVTLHPQ